MEETEGVPGENSSAIAQGTQHLLSRTGTVAGKAVTVWLWDRPFT